MHFGVKAPLNAWSCVTWGVMQASTSKVKWSTGALWRSVVTRAAVSSWTAADRECMAAALAIAHAAASRDEVPVGAVVTLHGQVIGRGGNQCVALHDTLQHAEMVALKDAVVASGLSRLDGATLYVTLEPCVMCLGACLLHHIHRVVYGASSPKFGACGSAVSLADHVHELSTARGHRRCTSGAVEGEEGTKSQPHFGLNHRLDIQGGLCAEDASGMLRVFFQRQRQRREGADGHTTSDPT